MSVASHLLKVVCDSLKPQGFEMTLTGQLQTPNKLILYLCIYVHCKYVYAERERNSNDKQILPICFEDTKQRYLVFQDSSSKALSLCHLSAIGLTFFDCFHSKTTLVLLHV